MSEQPPLFTARELEQFEQDRKRLALNAYLASGLPTSLEHEKLLTEKARLAAQAGETSLSAQPSSLGGGEKGFNFPQVCKVNHFSFAILLIYFFRRC
jgi:hypothetical protein